MKTQKLAAVLLTLALSLGASQGALADDNDMPTCWDELKAVEEAIEDTNSFSSKGRHGEPSRDQTRLLDKVEEAIMKLIQHKPAGALKKVGNIRAKVEELRDADKDKIDDDDANWILTKVEYAENCLDPTA
jgi:hypothetical protein